MVAMPPQLNSLTLYSGNDDLQSHRVRLVLAEKNLDELTLVVLRPADTSEDLLVLNPAHELPTLADRRLILSEARVIMEYLDERFPYPNLMPTDPVARATLRMAMHRLEQDVFGPATALAAGEKRQARVLRDNLVATAAAMGKRKFMLGDSYGLLDLSLTVVLWRLSNWGVKLPPSAASLQAYAERLFARPAFAASLTPEEAVLRS